MKRTISGLVDRYSQKNNGGSFVTHFLCLPPPTVEDSSPHGLRTVSSYHLFSLTFSSTQHCYRAVMQPAQNSQALPSFNIALHPDSYKTTLPNLSYPSRPSRHIPWSGSSAPLVFSVGRTFFSIVFCQSLTLFSLPENRAPRADSCDKRSS